MQQKTIITIFFVSIVFVGLIIWGTAPKSNTIASVQDAPDANSGPSGLTVQETLYDFGTISMANGKTNHVFKVSNTTKNDIEVKAVSTSCMCTNAYIVSADGDKGPFGMLGMGYVPPANERIKAGESRDIKVVYDPNAHGPSGVGMIDRYIYLTDASGGTLQLEIKAVVTP